MGAATEFQLKMGLTLFSGNLSEALFSCCIVVMVIGIASALFCVGIPQVMQEKSRRRVAWRKKEMVKGKRRLTTFPLFTTVFPKMPLTEDSPILAQ